MSWVVQFTMFPPTRNGKFVFGQISKNGKVRRRGYSAWSKEARSWGKDLRMFTRAVMQDAGVRGGDGTYTISIQLRVNDRRRRDPHNFVEFIFDTLQSPLESDDANFLSKTLPTMIVDTPQDVGIGITILKH